MWGSAVCNFRNNSDRWKVQHVAKAVRNGTVLAESEPTVVVAGNHSFPLESVNTEFFTPTEHSTHCPSKGDSSYHDITVS